MHASARAAAGEGLPHLGLAVADPHLDRAEAVVGRTLHQIWVLSTIEPVRSSNATNAA